MATYTSNYGWKKPSGSDNVDISVLNDNLDDQDSTIHDAFLNMAPPFSESSTYAVDDIVLYGTGLYKCHTAVVTPGSWTGSTNWQVYKLSEGGGGGLALGETSSTAYRGDRGKVAYDHSQTTGNPHGTTKSDVGLSNVPNVSTNDQTPTFTEASTRNNIASGEKLSVIFGKIQKFFNDLKTVAFSGSYTDLTNQPQINGNTLSGNKTSSQLGLSDASTVISWADWNQLTPQQQESGSYTITDCPWADGNVSVDLMTKLWENPSPSADFAAQTITLDSDDYDLLLIIYIVSTGNTRKCSELTIKGSGATLSIAEYSSNAASCRTRYFTYSSATVYNVSGGYINGTSANNIIIPYQVYGIKLTATVKINAIAMDVSTSADKCMLSDGETSVEENINTVYATGTITITDHNSLSNPYTCPSDGYIRIQNGNIGLCTKNSSNYWTILQNTGNTLLASIFVKKGSKVVVFNGNTGTSPSNAVFVTMGN